MKPVRQLISAPCPDCEEEIDLGPQPEVGDNLTCPECWAHLSVVNLDPPELRWVVDDDVWEFGDEDSEV